MATFTWAGGTAAWDTPGDWTIDGAATDNIPGSTDDVVISSGTVTLDQGMLATSALTIAAGGTLVGAGTVSGPVTNNGLLIAAPENTGEFRSPLTGDLVISDAVSGAGSIAISAVVPLFGKPFASTVELGGAVSENVSFDDNYGVLVIDSPALFTGTIEGFAGGYDAEFGHLYASDAVVISGLAVGSIIGKHYTGDTAGGTLTLQQATGSIALRFAGDHALADFVIADGSQAFSSSSPSIEITEVAPCFVAGTRIRTATGEVPVEALRIGDELPTLPGSSGATVRWLGYRRVDCARHPHPHDVWPIRVRAGAFAEHVPHRDLWLSPDHAVFIDGVLIPIRHLVNGASIAQEAVDAVTYWHVELARHEVILAEGLPCESYLDTGNRAAFANGGSAVQTRAAHRPWPPKRRAQNPAASA